MEANVRMLILSLKGNPVKIGDGPAAVTSPFSGFNCNNISGKRNPFGRVRHFSCLNGKAAERAGKSEDLSEQQAPKLSKNADFCLPS
jgi:hypothetical protein